MKQYFKFRKYKSQKLFHWLFSGPYYYAGLFNDFTATVSYFCTFQGLKKIQSWISWLFMTCGNHVSISHRLETIKIFKNPWKCQLQNLFVCRQWKCSQEKYIHDFSYNWYTNIKPINPKFGKQFKRWANFSNFLNKILLIFHVLPSVLLHCCGESDTAQPVTNTSNPFRGKWLCYVNLKLITKTTVCVVSDIYYMSLWWLGGLLVERRTSISQIQGSIPCQVAAV